MVFALQHVLIFIFGILGNIVSFCVFLAPVPTFKKIWKRKSTDGYKSLPYLVALFSSMLWIYYALHKSNDILLMTINAFGCVVETIYIGIFIYYAPKQPKATTLKRLILINFGGFATIVLLCHFFAKGQMQVKVLGWLCVTLSIAAFAAPLSVMRLVIRTKSVEFMPFFLSLFLTLSAVMWFSYGLLLKDIYITLPNILGLVFGTAQMILYAIYRKKENQVIEEKQKIPEHTINVVEISKINSTNKDEKPNTNNDEEKKISIKVEADEHHVPEQQQTTDDESAATKDEHEHNVVHDEKATTTLSSNERCMVVPIDDQSSQFIRCAAA